MSLGENIRNRRRELKLSQEYVAERLGVSRQAVSKWESGRSEPTARNLVELAEVFEVSLSELAAPGEAAAQKEKGDGEDEKKEKRILRMNLSALALSMQAGMLYGCTQIHYSMVEGRRTPDYRFMLVKFGLLFLCSLWMAHNLLYEKDGAQRRKNSRIELLYCCVQLGIALLTYHFGMGLAGLLLILAVLLFYILYINPRYMNRPFGKKTL